MERDKARSDLIALSRSICIGIGLNLGGRASMEIEEPFYTEAEWKRIQEEREAEREYAAELQQIAKLRRLGRQWQQRKS